MSLDHQARAGYLRVLADLLRWRAAPPDQVPLVEVIEQWEWSDVGLRAVRNELRLLGAQTMAQQVEQHVMAEMDEKR